MELKTTSILSVENGIVRVCYDKSTQSHSIEIRTDKGVEGKYISKKLYDFLIQELREQSGKS